MNMDYYSQYGQDKLLNEVLFKNKKNGTFVDIGANDGIGFSNTYFFEKNLNWKGICFEPLFEAFEKLNRYRKSININGCASDRNYEGAFYKITGYGEMFSGLISEYDEKHVARINRDIAEYGGTITETQVKCYNLNEILIKNQFRNIDFISIDTEGGELKILKSIDYSVIKIKAIVVENNYTDPEIYAFMRTKGFYRFAEVSSDEIYFHPLNYGYIKSFIIKWKLQVHLLFSKFERLPKKIGSAFLNR